MRINSRLSIAAGALQSLTTIVTRQKELAEQAANGTYSSAQRKALQSEANALYKEYNRIIKSTSFNGVRIIDGTDDSVRVQLGYGLTGGLTLNIGGRMGTAAGDGTFQQAVSIDRYNYDLVADFNNDGIADIGIGNGTQLSVRLGNGDGTFRNQNSIYAGGDSMSTFSSGDFNGDGVQDVIANVYSFSTGTSLNLYLGCGNGNFQAAKTIDISAIGAAFTVLVDDFDGDGKDDAVIRNNTTFTSSSVKFSNGGAATLTNLNFGMFHTVGYLNDINGDGYSDLFSNNSGTDYLQLGRGDGTFGPASTWTIGIPYIVDDFNDDGLMDLAAGEGIALGNGDGTFSSIQTSATGLALVVDINGDGYLDAVSSMYTIDLTFALGRGNGTFAASTSVVINPSFEIGLLRSADFNSDGVADIVFQDANSGGTYIILGNSDVSGRRNNLISNFDLTNIKGAKEALSRATQYLNRISQEVGNLGSLESRLTYAVNTLTNVRVNNLEAKGQIVDADIAGQAANLTKQKILQEAAASVLAQANQQPSLAIKLLR